MKNHLQLSAFFAVAICVAVSSGCQSFEAGSSGQKSSNPTSGLKKSINNGFKQPVEYESSSGKRFTQSCTVSAECDMGAICQAGVCTSNSNFNH